jgi:hypothetical protein
LGIYHYDERATLENDTGIKVAADRGSPQKRAKRAGSAHAGLVSAWWRGLRGAGRLKAFDLSQRRLERFSQGRGQRRTDERSTSFNTWLGDRPKRLSALGEENLCCSNPFEGYGATRCDLITACGAHRPLPSEH